MTKKLFSFLAPESRFVKDSLFIFLSTVAGGLLGFAFTICLSRLMGPADFGIFKTITAGYGSLIYLLDFGFQNTLMKYLSEFEAKGQEEKLKHLIQNLFFFKVVILAFVFIFSLTFQRELTSVFLKNSSLYYLVYPSLVFVVFTFLDITRPILIGLRNFKLLSVVNVLAPGLSILLVLPMVYWGGLGFAIVGSGISYVLGSAFSIRYLIKRKIHKKAKGSIFVFPKLALSYGIPSYFSALPSYIYLVIIPLVSLFFSQSKVGYFSFALSFYPVAMVVPLTISQILFPRISGLAGIKKSTKEVLFGSLFIYAIAAFFEIIFALLFTKVVIGFFAPAFSPATTLAIILITTGAFLGFLTILISYYTALSKLRIAFLLNIIGGLIFVFTGLAGAKFFL